MTSEGRQIGRQLTEEEGEEFTRLARKADSGAYLEPAELVRLRFLAHKNSAANPGEAQASEWATMADDLPAAATSLGQGAERGASGSEPAADAGPRQKLRLKLNGLGTRSRRLGAALPLVLVIFAALFPVPGAPWWMKPPDPIGWVRSLVDSDPGVPSPIVLGDSTSRSLRTGTGARQALDLASARLDLAMSASERVKGG